MTSETQRWLDDNGICVNCGRTKREVYDTKRKLWQQAKKGLGNYNQKALEEATRCTAKNKRHKWMSVERYNALRGKQ
jgi:hypothetical protein